MIARLEKTQNGYSIPLTAEMVEELRLTEGAVVEVRPVIEDADRSEAPVKYVSQEEALDSYERSKAKFGQAYEALAK